MEPGSEVEMALPMLGNMKVNFEDVKVSEHGVVALRWRLAWLLLPPQRQVLVSLLGSQASCSYCPAAVAHVSHPFPLFPFPV